MIGHRYQNCQTTKRNERRITMKTNLATLRKLSCLLMIFVLLFSTIDIVSLASAASVRSAEKVLTELISVKNQWARTTNQRTRNNLTKHADELRRELKQTKEYRNNIKVSSRNFKVDRGRDPGFKTVVNTLCMPPYDTVQNVQSALNYIKAYNMSFWGTVCIVTGGVILIGTLVYGGVAYGAKVIAGVGYTTAKWKTAVTTAISKVTLNKQIHILLEHHNWSKLVGSSVTWQKVMPYIQKALLYGQQSSYQVYTTKVFSINGHVVEVQYITIKGVLTIVDAWLKR